LYGPLAKLKAQLLEQFLIFNFMERDQGQPGKKRCLNMKLTAPAIYSASGTSVSLCQFVGVVELTPALFAANPGLRVVRAGASYKWDEARQGLVLVDLQEQ
jgi:hypothetical protein